jgi:stearoyl-CoA desaturase (delta-9 desaturase)
MAHKHAVPKWVEKILTVLTIPMISGSPLGWVLVHRIHHINEDTENDPHSPLFKSTLWIHLMSITYLPKTIRPVTDLLKDKFQTKFHRVYVILCVVWLSSLFIILSVDHFALLVALPSTLTWHLGSSINSFGHSKKLLGPINSPILSMFTFGEGSHKNHHNDPRKLRFNASTVLDLGGYLLEKVVIKNVTK